MERKNGHRPISAGLLLVGIVLTVVGLFGSLWGKPLEEQVMAPSSEELLILGTRFSQELPGLSEITLDTAFGSIEVVEGSRSDISVSGFEEGSVNLFFENGQLVVRQHKPEGLVLDPLKKLLRQGARDVLQSGRIVITVAKDTRLKSVDIDHAAGNLHFAGISAEKAEIAISAGELWVEGGSFDKIAVTGGAGNISLQDLAILKEIQADCGAGNILLSGSLTGDARLKCGAGNITAELEGNPKDFSIDAEAGLGQVTFNGTLYGKGAGIRSLWAAYEIKAETGAGNVDISIK